MATYSGRTETTWYVGSLYERMSKTGSTTIEYRYQVTAGGLPVARVTEYSTDISRTQYMLRDHLGSIDTILNEDGSVSARTSFDAHGSRRAADAVQGSPWQSNLKYTLAAASIDGLRDKTTRGFTDHEVLDSVGLAHMNGRVYDPALGRFLSVDPVFQFPTNTQSLNPYTYVLNSPLSFTDPTGLEACPTGDGEKMTCPTTPTRDQNGDGKASTIETAGGNVVAVNNGTKISNGAQAETKKDKDTSGKEGVAKRKTTDNKCDNCRSATDKETRKIKKAAEGAAEKIKDFRKRLAEKDEETLKGLRQHYGFDAIGSDDEVSALVKDLDSVAAGVLGDMEDIAAGRREVFVSTDDKGGEWGAADKGGAYEVGGRFLNESFGSKHVETMLHEGAHQYSLSHPKEMTGDLSRGMLNSLGNAARSNPSVAEANRLQLSTNAYAFEREVVGR